MALDSSDGICDSGGALAAMPYPVAIRFLSFVPRAAVGDDSPLDTLLRTSAGLQETVAVGLALELVHQLRSRLQWCTTTTDNGEDQIACLFLSTAVNDEGQTTNSATTNHGDKDDTALNTWLLSFMVYRGITPQQLLQQPRDSQRHQQQQPLSQLIAEALFTARATEVWMPSSGGGREPSAQWIVSWREALSHESPEVVCDDEEVCCAPLRIVVRTPPSIGIAVGSDEVQPTTLTLRFPTLHSESGRRTPCDAAVCADHVKCLFALKQAAARSGPHLWSSAVTAPDKNGRRAALTAAEMGRSACLKLLTASDKGVQVNGAIYWVWLLRAAVKFDRVDCVRLLMDTIGDATLNGPPMSHLLGPLVHVAAVAGSEACLRILVEERGLAVHHVGSDGLSALFHAATIGHVGCVRLLLSRDVNGRAVSFTSAGRTIVHAAAKSGNVQCLRLAIQAAGAAAASSCDAAGRNALFDACEAGDAECLQELRDACYLCVHCVCSVTGNTPAHVAAVHGHLDCLRLLFNWGADVSRRENKRDQTAVFAAAEAGQVSILRYLREEARVDLSATSSGKSAWWWAVNSQSQPSLSYLDQCGLQPKQRSCLVA